MRRIALVAFAAVVAACGAGDDPVAAPSPSPPSAEPSPFPSPAPTPSPTAASPAPSPTATRTDDEALPEADLTAVGAVVVPGSPWQLITADGSTPLAVDVPPARRFRAWADGTVVVQPSDADDVEVWDPGSAASRVLVAAPDEAGRRVLLLGGDTLDGRRVALVADGRARSLNDDDGVDIVAIDVDDASRTVLLDDASPAWEAGVEEADLRDGWLLWHARSLTLSLVFGVPLDDLDRVERIVEIDAEAEGRDVTSIALASGPDGVAAVVTVLERAGFPDEPSATLLWRDLLDGSTDTEAVPDVGWERGWPVTASAGDGVVVFGRAGEGSSPGPALLHRVSGEPRWARLVVDGAVRVARP